MHKLAFALAVALLPAASVPALADPIITVTPWLAPNAFGSPSYAGAVANQEYAISHGLTTYGSAGPTQYNAQLTPFYASQSVVTGFNSWMGVADPGGAYSNELGNRMLFGIAINGNGSQFSISQLSFSSVSSDHGDLLGFGFGAGSYNYSQDYVGVLFNPDGSVKAYITSGPNTQMVDALYGRGSGNSYEPSCTPDNPDPHPDCGTTTAQHQADIMEAASQSGGPYTFTGTYTLGNTTGSGTFNVLADPVAATPEPSSLALLGTGVLGIAGALRRRIKANR